MKIRDIGEFGWINRVRNRLPSYRDGVRAGIGDDAAWIKIQDSTLITCDLLIENIHFLRQVHPARLLGRKALSVNLSDLAAMSGIPLYALIAVGFPPDTGLEYADELLEGFLEVARENKVELIGGDTSASEKLIISVTALGKPAQKKPVLRSGAKPGDDLWVTGTIGDAALGFELLKKSRAGQLDLSDFHHSSLLVRHFDPAPRLPAGIKLGPIAHSMIDLSDGLLPDLGHLLEESGKDKNLRATVLLDRLPISREFSEYFGPKPLAGGECLSLMLAGGEDYELLFTAAPAAGPGILKIGQSLNLKMSKIGKMESADQAEIILLDKKGKIVPHPRARFEHFPEKESPEN